jgi:hypothetical protein
MTADSGLVQVTCCQGCGCRGFLAWDEESGRALCIDCHERAGTLPAAGGHCCEDRCGLDVDHDGLRREHPARGARVVVFARMEDGRTDPLAGGHEDGGAQQGGRLSGGG